MKTKEVIWAMERIVLGSSDPTPTRKIYFDNEQAMKVDSWWQDYYSRERLLTSANALVVLDYVAELEMEIDQLKDMLKEQ